MKRILYIFISLIILVFSWALHSTPVLSGLGKSVEVSVSLGGSASNFITVPSGTPIWANFGESVVVDSEENLLEFIKLYNIDFLFSESTFDGVSYYGYSKKIPHVEIVNGKKVNFHVHCAGRVVKVGIPLIYGSF